MGYAVVLSRANQGLDAPPVRVEVDLSNGLPTFTIVGMPETAVRESRDRVRSALLNSHFDFPDRRITVNLAPADLPKGGGRFDLPIALGVLVASGQLPAGTLRDSECLGELALDGSLRPVQGGVAATLASVREQHRVVLPPGTAQRAARVPGSRVLTAADLLSLCAVLRGRVPGEVRAGDAAAAPGTSRDLAEVVGQPAARRALEIAAAGGHKLPARAAAAGRWGRAAGNTRPARPARPGRVTGTPPVPGPAPQRQRGGAGRWRQPAAARRGVPGAWRGAVPR